MSTDLQFSRGELLHSSVLAHHKGYPFMTGALHKSSLRQADAIVDALLHFSDVLFAHSAEFLSVTASSLLGAAELGGTLYFFCISI